MSKVEYKDTNVKCLIYDYKDVLQKKISEVCMKIGFNDCNVNWFIYDPRKGKNTVEYALVGERGKDYGYCFPEQMDIYVSVLAIETHMKTLHKFVGVNGDKDFLADVIIDEITHIQTKKDHEDAAYRIQLKRNKENFYCTLSERTFSKTHGAIKGSK